MKYCDFHKFSNGVQNLTVKLQICPTHLSRDENFVHIDYVLQEHENPRGTKECKSPNSSPGNDTKYFSVTFKTHQVEADVCCHYYSVLLRCHRKSSSCYAMFLKERKKTQTFE